MNNLSNVQKRVIDCGMLMQAAIGAIELALVDTGDHHLPNSWLEETYENQIRHAKEHLDNLIIEEDLFSIHPAIAYKNDGEDNLTHTICRLAMARVLKLYKIDGGRKSTLESTIHQVNGGRV